MSKIYTVALDAGHGVNTPGKRSPQGEREWTFNKKVVEAIERELKKYDNIRLIRLDDRSGATDVPLITRTNKANAANADLLVSVHHNANNGSWGRWTGTETYVYTPASANPKSVRLAECVHKGLVSAYGLKDRGIKAADFHMLRESNCAAILTEGGYMDSEIDIEKLRDDKVLAQAGIAIARGILKFLGIDTKATSTLHTSTSDKKPKKKPVLKKGTKAETYVIKGGDTLYSISKKFKVSVADLKKWNKLSSDILTIGNVLVVAPSVSITKHYKVKAGDSLWSIASKFDTSVDKLKSLNKLSGDVILVGDELRVK